MGETARASHEPPSDRADRAEDAESLPEHVAINRRHWDERADSYAAAARRQWSADEPRWGICAIPQSELPMMPADVAGKDVIELGCGTGYVSAWLARRGARPVGIDNSPRQLATARAMQAEFGLHFPLHLGNAEATPFPDASFDLAISEYGASIWCDSYRWIPEAARLLRPGGQLVFLRGSTLLALCERDEGPALDRLARDQRGLHRLEWHDPPGPSVEFHLPHGELIRLLHTSGFTLEGLVEVIAPEGATVSSEYVTAGWGRRWPVEEVWTARLR